MHTLPRTLGLPNHSSTFPSSQHICHDSISQENAHALFKTQINYGLHKPLTNAFYFLWLVISIALNIHRPAMFRCNYSPVMTPVNVILLRHKSESWIHQGWWIVLTFPFLLPTTSTRASHWPNPTRIQLAKGAWGNVASKVSQVVAVQSKAGKAKTDLGMVEEMMNSIETHRNQWDLKEWELWLNMTKGGEFMFC